MIFLGILAVLCGIGCERAVIVIRERARAVEVIVRIGRHGIDLSRCGVHDDAAGTRFATGFDRRFLEIFFEIALDFVINGRDKICAVLGVYVGFIIIRHGAALSVFRGEDFSGGSG